MRMVVQIAHKGANGRKPSCLFQKNREKMMRKPKFAESPISVWISYVRPKNPIEYGVE